ETWVLGQSDVSAEKLEFAQSGTDGNGPYVEIEGVGKVRGEAQIFADLLTKGIAADMGRSHGFFVLVRGRLINLDDALFGLPALDLIDLPTDLSDEQREELRAKLAEALDSETGLIQEVKMAPLGVDRYLATFDPFGLCVVINVLHPFFANYIEEARSIEPFE